MTEKTKENEEQKEEKSLSDLLGMQFKEDGSWIAVRPSGTEPKVKVYYCVTGSSHEEADQKAKEYETFMKGLMA